MDLPKLSAGKRFTLPRPPGSADALLLARLAEREKAAGKLTAIVTADATDAQRLIDEMAFFAPDLRCALFPDWETLPYDSFSPHQDLISERLATLWRISQGEADVVMVPATTALYRVAPPSFLAGYTFHFQVKQKLEEAKLKAQLTLAGYSHVTQVVSPGEYAVRGGLIDLFPMGSHRALPGRPVRRRDRFDPHLRPRQPAQPVPRARGAPAARPRVPDGRRRARELPQPLARTAGGRPDQEPHLQGHRQRRRHGRHRVLPAAVLRRHGDGVRLPRRAGHRGAARRPGARVPALLAGHARPLPAGARRPRAPGAAAGDFVSHGRAVLCARQSSMRSWRCAPCGRGHRAFAELEPCRPWPWCAAPKSRWPASRSTCATRRTACWCWPKATAGARACWTSCAPATCRRRPSIRWRSSWPATRSWASPPRR